MKWIKVGDNLPEYNQKVLAYSKVAEKIYICYRIKKLEYTGYWILWEDQNGSCAGCMDPISHWMPLPTPPNENSDYPQLTKTIREYYDKVLLGVNPNNPLNK